MAHPAGLVGLPYRQPLSTLSQFGIPISLSRISGNELPVLTLMLGLPSQGLLLSLAAPSTRCNITCEGIRCVSTGQGLKTAQRSLRSQGVCGNDYIQMAVFEKPLSGTVLKEHTSFTVLKEHTGGVLKQALSLFLPVCEPLELKLTKLFIKVYIFWISVNRLCVQGRIFIGP